MEEIVSTAMFSVPERFRDCTLDDFQGEKAKFRKYILGMRKYVKAGKGFFIHGSGISGKSMLAGILASAADAYGYEIVFTDLEDLTDAKFRNMDNYSIAKTCDFLVVDGIGLMPSGAVNEGHAAVVQEIVSYRYSAKKPIVITTRLLTKKFESHFGGRAIEKLRLMCVFHECQENQQLLKQEA